MEEKKHPKGRNKAKILMQGFQNIVQLCEKKDDKGKSTFLVQINTGQTIFWAEFDEFDALLDKFRQVVNVKQQR